MAVVLVFCCAVVFWGFMLWVRTWIEFSRYWRVTGGQEKKFFLPGKGFRRILVDNLLQATLYERLLLGMKKREEKKDLLQDLFALMTSVFDVDYWNFLLPGETVPWYCYVASPGCTEENLAIVSQPGLPLHSICVQKRALFVEDVRFSPPYAGYSSEGSWAGIPLLDNSEVCGILCLSWNRRHSLSRGQLSMIERTAWLLLDSMNVVLGMEVLFSQAEKDSLTGALNRTRLQEMTASPEASKFRGNAFFFDIDKFKELNDLYGHDVGDRALIEFAMHLRQRFPEYPLFRYGGDEFLLIQDENIESSDKEDVLEYLNIMKDALHERPHGAPPVYFSVGVATVPEDAPSLGEAIRIADQTMYERKKRRKMDNSLSA